MMDNRLRIVACTFLLALVLGLAGCAGGGEERIISGGYMPIEVTNIASGGEFDASSLSSHESSELTLKKLEGFWLYEGIADDSTEGSEHKDGSVVVTEKTITLNEEKIECLPKSIDIRPYSPMKALISQGFGYGSAVFQEKADDSDSLGIYVGSLSFPSSPYSGNGFICTIHGNTLALGFVGAEAKLDAYGKITDEEGNVVDECALTEVNYEISLDGDRLTLTYDGVSATYLYRESTLETFSIHRDMCFGEPLWENDYSLSILGRNPRDLPDKGFKLDCDMDAMLSSCSISESFGIMTPGGAVLSAKVVNPYEKTIPIGYAKVCWYEYDKENGENVTIGPRSHSSQEFGVASYADVYNNYVLPYEASQDSLSYKTGYSHIITSMTAWDEGYDTGDAILESEHSCDIKLNFTDNVLSSIAVSDPVYLNAGLQDNIAHDDLDDLKPSVYREVTVQRDEILDELKKTFKKAGLDVAINEKTGEVVMDNNVLFESGSYELGGEGKAYLDKMFSAYASVVLDEKYSSVLKEVSFEGNTDSDGDSEHNMRLSENRAHAVMEYCSGLLDDKQRATWDEFAVCRGYGESDLVYNENGSENKDASRRVAIKFMLNVDSLKSEVEPQEDSGSSISASSASSSFTGSDSPSSSSVVQDESDELQEFRSISNKFNQAWTLYEESESDGTQHVAILLLSKDHSYCGYFDLKLDASSNPSGYYTFGEADIEETAANAEAITVHHGGDNDRLDVIFNAWGKENMVNLKDPWEGLNDLIAFEDVDAAIATFEEILG